MPVSRSIEANPYISWRHTSNQSIPDSTWTTLQWDQHLLEVGGNWTVGGQPGQIQYPTGGLYNVIVDIHWATNATGIRGIASFKSPFLVPKDQVAGSASALSGAAGQHQQFVMQTGGGVIQEIQVWQNSGGALNVLSDGLLSPTITAVRVSSL